MRALNVFITFSLSVFLSACSVQSSQLSAVMSLFNAPSASALEGSAWNLRYGDYQSRVYAIAISDGTLFSNEQGDQVLFDGWVVREIKGLGNFRSRWQVEDYEASRELNRSGKPAAIHDCGVWSKAIGSSIIGSAKKSAAKQIGSSFNEDRTLYTQSCEGTAGYTNVIEVNVSGEIEVIAQVIDASQTRFLLTKADVQ